MVGRLYQSVIRTVVPWLVGLIIAGLLRVGLRWEDTDGLTEVVTVVVGTGYYAVVRYVEEKVDPKFGWLIGAPGAPKYGGKHAA